MVKTLRKGRKQGVLALTAILLIVELVSYTLMEQRSFPYHVVFFTVAVIGFYWFFSGRTIKRIEALEKQFELQKLRFEAMVNQSSDGMYMFDPETKRVIEVSERFCEMLGYTEQQMKQMEITDFIFHSPQSVDLNIETVLKRKRSFVGQRQYMRHDKTIIYVDVSATLLEIDGQPYFLVNVRDVTKQLADEQQLRLSENRYLSLFNNNQGACFVTTIHGHFVEVNAMMEQLTGYTRQELIGTNYVPLLEKTQINRVASQLRAVLEGEPVTFQTTFINKTGQAVDLHVNLTPLINGHELEGVIGIAEDITQQRIAQQKLVESQRRYRSLVNLQPEVVFVYAPDEIKFVNDKVTDYFGVPSPKDVIGQSIFPFIREGDREHISYLLMKGLQQSDTRTKEVSFIRQDGSSFIGEVSVSLIDYNGESALLGIIRDITDKKEAERKLEEANRMLTELSLMDGLTSIANRRCYEETIEKEWNRALRDNLSISLLMIDIDHFKLFNDTYGHQEGDSCLKQIAQSIRETLKRPADFVARYGGEEFAVVLPNTDKEGATYIAEQIRFNVELLDLPNENSPVKPFVTLSVGACTVKPKTPEELTLFTEHADIALYHAKKHGRNCTAFYASSDDDD